VSTGAGGSAKPCQPFISGFWRRRGGHLGRRLPTSVVIVIYDVILFGGDVVQLRVIRLIVRVVVVDQLFVGDDWLVVRSEIIPNCFNRKEVGRRLFVSLRVSVARSRNLHPLALPMGPEMVRSCPSPDPPDSRPPYPGLSRMQL
jgi:hypothetical protein